ncbi:MAG: M48 family metallopeptidase [Thermovirgaceae bacterium]
MKKAKVLLPALIFMFTLFVATADAGLNKNLVPRIWGKLTSTAGISNAGPVHLEEEKTPNAWVSFQGNTYSVHATTGLLDTLGTEDELAGVLAHEIGHIKSGHYNEAAGRSLLWYLLFRAVKNEGDLARGAFGVGMALAEAGFSREQEIEADIYGIRLSAKAGYDPWGLYNSMLRMKKAGFKTSPSGFNSHPPTDRRLTRIRQETEAVTAARK